MTSFLAVTFSSPWETIEHMLIFNVLLDASMICAGVFAWSAIRNTYRSKGVVRRQAAMAFPADAFVEYAESLPCQIEEISCVSWGARQPRR